MAAILIIGDDAPVQSWASTLGKEHEVEVIPTAADLPSSEADAELDIDIVIVDIANPDSGEAMPIPHAHAIWPHCKIIAITSGYAFRTSAFYRMGLWSPDQLILKPVTPRILRATVNFLWAQIRTEQVRKMITPVGSEAPAFEPPSMTHYPTARPPFQN